MNVDDAILGLNEALDDLGNIRVRSDDRIRRAPELNISPEEAKACINSRFNSFIDPRMITIL
jgi:hypothetical protein